MPLKPKPGRAEMKKAEPLFGLADLSRILIVAYSSLRDLYLADRLAPDFMAGRVPLFWPSRIPEIVALVERHRRKVK